MEQGLRNKEKQVTWLINTFITLNKNALIHLARLLDNPDSFADNLMTRIFRLKFNNRVPYEKTGFVTSWSKECFLMLERNFPKLLEWDMFYHNFVETFTWILLRHWRAFSLGGLFSLSTHALTCLSSSLRLTLVFRRYIVVHVYLGYFYLKELYFKDLNSAYGKSVPS